MLRIRLTKLKEVCTTALLPRIFKDTKYDKKKINACYVEHLSKLKKSTDSSSNDEQYEKQKRIIEKSFAERFLDIEIKEADLKNKDGRFCKSDLDESTRHLETRYIDNDKYIRQEDNIQDESRGSTVQATTVKIEEEKLTQKIDQIDEVPHVEAGATNIEGFNVTPKVIGHENTNFKIDGEQNDRTYSGQTKQLDLDTLAKRCLSTPTGDFDHALLTELRNLSHKDSHTLKVDLSNDNSVEKYFSQILEKSKGKLKESPELNQTSEDILDANVEQIQKNLNEVKGFSENESRPERFQPLHLDTVPLFTTDNNNKGLEVGKPAKDCLLLATNNLGLDIPAVLSPYDVQAIPFYEYINKEILEKDTSKDLGTRETASSSNLLLNIPTALSPYDMPSVPFYNYLNKDTIEDVTNEDTYDLSETIHLHTVPMLTIDCYGQDNIKNVIMDENSSIDEATNLLTDVSTILNPYDMQAIPFYEYMHKEIYNDISEEEIDPEIIEQVSDIPVNEDIDVKKIEFSEYNNLLDSKIRELDYEDSQTYDTKTYAERTQYSSINLEPTNLSESDVLKLLEYKNVLSVKPEYSTVEHVLSFTTDDSQGQYPGHETQNIPEIPNSAISGTFPINNTKQTLEIPENTAISANQAPDEYYQLPNTSNFKPITQLESTDSESLFRDYAVSQSMVFSTLPQHLDVEENNEVYEESVIKSEHVIFYPNGPFTHVVFKSDPKQKEIESLVKSEKNDAGICPENAIPLSLLWKRLRQRNRLEQLNSDLFCSQAKSQPETGTCNRPLDKSKPKTTLQPGFCKPKPKPVCPQPCPPKKDPCPPPCPPKKDPCPPPCPPKKDPCSKFLPFFLTSVINSDVSLEKLSALKMHFNQEHTHVSILDLVIEGTVERLKNITQILDILNRDRNNDTTREIVNAVCARDFEPWIPIPSWPIPKDDKKRPLVCPKDGCKLPAQRPNPPNINKPCLGAPKKISLTKTFCTSFTNTKV